MHSLRSTVGGVVCLLFISFVHAESPREAFGVLVENDSFFGDDGNYTGGFSISYESDALQKYGSESRLARWSGWRRHLPGFDASRDERMSIAFSGLAFTPENIEAKGPLPDETPYMGAVAVDVQATSRGESDQHLYSIRFGWVGPSSQMGNIQEGVHSLTDSDDPRGWDNQLPDEPLINLSYAYTRRMFAGQFDGGWQWDVSPGVGASAGTYFTGVNASLFLRFGRNLGNSFGITSIDGGVQGTRNVVERPGDEWRYQFTAGVAAFAIGHYMPFDGTVFKDSPSVDHDDFVSVASLGLAVGKGNVQMDLLYNAWSDVVAGSTPRSRFAGMHFSWFLE